jgi:hypothetical protein
MSYNNQSVAVEPGTPVVVGEVPASASIGVAPGSGGSMSVSHRVSPNGPLYPWEPGSVTAPAMVSTTSPFFRVVFKPTGVAGLADWNWIEPAQRPQ